MTTEENDCDFLYFKPGGKWKYEGEGRWPRQQTPGWHEVDRAEIARENNGMPGISGNATDLIVVVIPRESCTQTTAYPRLLLPEDSS